MKKILGNIGIVLVTTSLMLLFCEVVVRAFFGDQTSLFPRYHTDARYGEFTLRKIRPNSEFLHKSVDGTWRFVTNAQGFRNYEDIGYSKPANTLRILSLGDSHTQGYEVRQDHTFSAVVARYLSRENFDVEVINAGVSGFSTAEALLFLENEGIKYEPDYVLLGFYRNDLEDNLKAGLFKLDDNNELVVAKKSHIPGVRIQNIIYALPGVQWLSENSYFYSVLFNATWQYFKKKLAKSKARDVTEYAVAKKKVYSDYEINLAASLLERLYAFSAENGVKLVVIDIPAIGSNGTIKSSFPPALMARVRDSNNAFVDSVELLEDFSGVAEMHRPNGAKHITEFTHTILGVAAAKEIAALEQKR